MITSRRWRASAIALPALLVLVGCCVGIARAAEVGTGSGKVTLAATTSTLPRLLTEDFSTSFAVRPTTIFPTGDGSIVIGKLGKRGHDIRWHKWTTSRAYGLATVWIDNGIPNVAQGTFHGYSGSINASRVRDGRFTRMTVRCRKGGKLRAWSLTLKHLGTPGWTWHTRK